MNSLGIGFGPRKIIINPLEDLLCLAWSEFRFDPNNWIAIAFVIVAAVNTVAQRNDICRYCAGASWIAKWYPMISGKSVPQASRSIAYGAATTEIVKTTLPIGSRELVGKALFTRFATLFTNSFYEFDILFMLLSIILLSSSYSFGVRFSPMSVLWDVRVPIGTLVTLFFVFVLLIVQGFAGFTYSYMTIGALGMLVKLIDRLGNATLSASLEEHLRFSFANLCIVYCGQACKGLAVRVVHEATLAHSGIIPQEMAL